MKFTPSANWNLISSASNRVITWTVSIKKTTALNEALSAGTWVDVTSFLTELPAITQRIEYELGQFSSDSISFTARNIDWWEANVFNATAYIELKITATMSMGTITTTDVFYAFSGFIDKVGVQYDEINDTVSFDVFTADELGNRISALNINTQYINTDCDGSGTNGLILPAISGIYVTDASGLKIGLHTIEYVYATRQVRVDDGAYSTMGGSDESITLYNLAADESIVIWIDYGAISQSEVAITDYIIVVTASTAIPRQPYYKLGLKTTLKKAYSQIGIDTVTFDTLELNTFDGGKKISLFENVPEDSSIIGKRSTIVGDGTDLYFTVANKLYKRTTSTGLYSLVATYSADGNAYGKKLMWNARNSEFWIYYQSTNGDCIKKISIDGDVISAEVVLSATPSTVNRYSVEPVDVNYAGTSWKYGILWMKPEDPAVIRFISSASMTSASIFNYPSTVKTVQYQADFIFTKATNDFQILLYSTSVAGTILAQFQIDGSGDFQLIGVLSGRTTWTSFSIGAYHPSEDRLYYYEYTSGGINTSIKSIPRDAAGSATTVLSGAYYNPRKTLMLYADGQVFTATRGYLLAGVDLNGTLYSIISNTATVLDSSIYSEYGALTFQGRLYGIDGTGSLYQYHTVLNMFTQKDLIGQSTVKDFITNILQSYNLTSTISANKTAFVYRRGNDAGDIQSTGNNITLGESNISQIQRVINEYQKILWVKVTSGETSYSYDGTTYNAGILSDSKTLEISNDLIPEAIVQDLAKYFYAFYHTAHDKYTFNVDVPLMQYEVMDGVTISTTNTKILVNSSTGLITGQTINNDGSMSLEVIF